MLCVLRLAVFATIKKWLFVVTPYISHAADIILLVWTSTLETLCDYDGEEILLLVQALYLLSGTKRFYTSYRSRYHNMVKSMSSVIFSGHCWLYSPAIAIRLQKCEHYFEVSKQVTDMET